MDRISNLPDDVLLKILSKGTTEHSVSTSGISRRFRDVWKYMEKFHFYGYSTNYASLNAFLNNIFLPQFMAPNLKTFRIRLLEGKYNPDHINAWMQFVVSRNINNLYFDCEIQGLIIPLPISIFNCNSLEKLQLEGGSIILEVPDNASLPSLKHLEIVNVSDLSTASLQNVLKISPALKFFRLDCYRNVENPKEYTVFSNSVEKLLIDYGDRILKLEVNTPSVKYLEIDNGIDLLPYPIVSFQNMPNIEEASASFGDVNLESFIGSITSVTKLTLCSTVVIRYPLKPFMLMNLENLELCWCNSGRVNLCDLLMASPNVRVLKFFEIKGHPGNEGFSSPRVGTTVPRETLKNLQVLYWSDFPCCSSAMNILRDILEDVTSLQKVDIYFKEGLRISKSCNEEILKIPLASAECDLNIYYDEFPDDFS